MSVFPTNRVEANEADGLAGSTLDILNMDDEEKTYLLIHLSQAEPYAYERSRDAMVHFFDGRK